MLDVRDQVEALLRRQGPRLVAALARAFRDIELAEEVVQDAAIKAMEVWPVQGLPEQPAAWLYAVARHRALDQVRQRTVARDYADAVRAEAAPGAQASEPTGDHRLALLFACCHPAIEPRNQVGLALRTLCGLPNEAVARAFLESPEAMRRRLSRASRKIRDAGIPFEVPGPRQRGERVAAVMSSIYLLFNEGYAPTTGLDMVRPEVCAEAIRLSEAVSDLLPQEPEVLGLVALMRLHHARRDARHTTDQALVRLEDQDRNRWRRDEIEAGLRDLDQALTHLKPGPYQLQAAIAALHARAASIDETDWVQITALYGTLLRHQPTPIVELNAAVALAMSHGPEQALDWVDRLAARGQLVEFHLLHAVRGDLLVRLGRRTEASLAFDRAGQLTENLSERRYLEERSRNAREVQRRRRSPTPNRRTTLTDREWSRIAHLFPPPKRSRGRPPRPDRHILEAVLWVLTTGAPWRALPPTFGPWQTAYHRFRKWESEGRLSAIAKRLGPRLTPPPPLNEGA
ncbi:MAG: DUF6596 domain-containing protein [Myxococcota bacterium]